ncbi:MAG: hypothetical protein ACKV2O_06135 [Acidimicrobiales bacterium]
MSTYRADHVGSLLRPPAVLHAHARQAAGELHDDAVRAIEDEAILSALAMQREVGLDILSDGEYRRTAWSIAFPDSVTGYVSSEMPIALDWKIGEGDERTTVPRRVRKLPAFLPLDQLALSPQCGFASVDAGNLLSWDEQRRKLELVTTVARRVWGDCPNPERYWT